MKFISYILIVVFVIVSIAEKSFEQTKTAKISGITGNKIQIDLGSEDGLKVGMKGQVHNNITVGGKKTRINLAIVEIIEIREYSCFCKINKKVPGKEIVTGLSVDFNLSEKVSANDIVNLSSQAYKYYKESNYTNALELYKEILQIDPENKEAKRMIEKINSLLSSGSEGRQSSISDQQTPHEQSSPTQGGLTDQEIQAIIDKVKNLPDEPVQKGEVAVIITDLGTIKFKFLTDVAPKTCANFKKLANAGFYDGTIFHRVIKGFMIQGGDILSRDAIPENDGVGEPGYTIPAEFSKVKHFKGTVSMARKQDTNSAGSQFFICQANAPHLDGQQTVFGVIIEGMDVLDKIADAPVGERDRPLNLVVMKKVRVEKQ